MQTKSEAQAFRSEVNVPLPPRKVAISGAISRVLNHWGTECRVPKTALNLHASVPSLLQAHASLSVVKASTAESGLNWDKEEDVNKRQVRLRVNGREYEEAVEPRKLLVDFIREDLGLTGTHVGCEHGVCGACTILWDGEPVRSCIAFAVQANGADIETVEGLAPSPTVLHPIQEAFWKAHGLQCGFCTPGFLLTVKALLRNHPKPSEPEIRAWISGNLCRCTGYQNIVTAVQQAAEKLAGSSE